MFSKLFGKKESQSATSSSLPKGAVAIPTDLTLEKVPAFYTECIRKSLPTATALRQQHLGKLAAIAPQMIDAIIAVRRNYPDKANDELESAEILTMVELLAPVLTRSDVYKLARSSQMDLAMQVLTTNTSIRMRPEDTDILKGIRLMGDSSDFLAEVKNRIATAEQA